MSTLKSILPAVTLLAFGVLAAGCVVPPEEDPVLIKLDELDRRVDSIERVVSNQSLLQLAADLETLSREVRELRGDTEALQHEVERAAVRQRDQYLDLDQRLQSLERRTRTGGEVPETVAGVEPAPAAGGPAPSGDQRASYQSALELLRQGRYERAEAAFSQYLADFPDGELADNAQYWLAETHYVNREFEQALAGFRRVLEEYPNSRKTPDAMLKAGFCQHELGQVDEAVDTLETVIAQYPDSTASRLANQRLDRIRAEAR